MPTPMNEAASAVARAMTQQSDAERISFPEVLARLGEAGIERYHVDLPGAVHSYYLPDGAVVTVSAHETPPAAAAFAPEEVARAVAEIQRGQIDYRTFCARVARAGCVGWHVSLIGRRVVYYGRTGDSHVEWFPGTR